MEPNERTELIEMYANGYDAVIAALSGITASEWESREAPGEWCAREICHHLGDSEMNAAIRVRRLIADDPAQIDAYDQDEWVRLLFSDQPVEPSLDAFRAARAATIGILRLMSDAQWTREGTHSERGPMTAETWLSWYGTHAHDHADQIRRARAGTAS